MAIPCPKPPRGKIVQAAGALIWRVADHANTYPGTSLPRRSEDIEVLIVHRPKYNDWSWPKGKREQGESIFECATREVEEETGVAVRLQAPLTTQRYRLGSHTTKAVYYWLGRVDIASSALRARTPVHPASVKEIDHIQWVAPAQAMRLLTRRGDRRLLDELIVKLRSGALDTIPFIVIRHGRAIPREQWHEGELSRPLNREGVSQVRQLTGIFSAYGINEFVTSPWRRCLATVGTYASLCGANVNIVQEASEEAFNTDKEGFVKLVKSFLTPSFHQPTALCVHRPTLSTVCEELRLHTPLVIARQIPQEDPYLRTSEMLICHIAMVPLALFEKNEERQTPRASFIPKPGPQLRPRIVSIERTRPVSMH